VEFSWRPDPEWRRLKKIARPRMRKEPTTAPMTPPATALMLVRRGGCEDAAAGVVEFDDGMGICVELGGGGLNILAMAG